MTCGFKGKLLGSRELIFHTIAYRLKYLWRFPKTKEYEFLDFQIYRKFNFLLACSTKRTYPVFGLRELSLDIFQYSQDSQAAIVQYCYRLQQVLLHSHESKNQYVRFNFVQPLARQRVYSLESTVHWHSWSVSVGSRRVMH